MLGLSPLHLIILLVVVLLIFGTRKLRNIGADLGAAVRGFKDGMKEPGQTGPQATPTLEAKGEDKPHP